MVGKLACWFCDVYVDVGPAWQRGAERSEERLLLIKYVVERQRATRLNDLLVRRRIPGELHLVPFWVGRPPDLSALQTGRSWTPLLRSVEVEQNTPSWMMEMDAALSFLLDFRRVQQEARSFPYRIKESSGFLKTLEVDTEWDERRQFSDALKTLYFRDFRQPMGPLFEGLDGEMGGLLSAQAAGTRTQAGTRVEFMERLDDQTIQVRLLPGQPDLPERGIIRPVDDFGDWRQLERQTVATRTLQRSPALLEQLHDPTTIAGLRARWQGVGAGLRGRGSEIVKNMLTHRPFYALHGPPGTGKTTVAAHAVAAHLRADPSQRLLISSQSHHALDHLALGVLKRAPSDVVAIRVASEQALADGRVDEHMQRYLPGKQVDETVKRIQRACEKALAQDELADGRPLDDTLKALLVDWKTQCSQARPEIERRLRRGANLVFATANACTTEAVNPQGGLFDWAIIEEAARAWPTELALPLVQALRWTLIGDHLQLPAFDELSVQRFLKACRQDPNPELRALGQQEEVYERTFRLFGSLFEQRASRRQARARASQLEEPLDELNLQFRMHPDICALVSRAFYHQPLQAQNTPVEEEGWLLADESTRKDHGLEQPRFLRKRALLWLDTQGVPDGDDQRAWKNDGEVRIVRRLLERMDPIPDHPEGFALLTPYRAQLNAFLGAGLPSWALPHLHTVDSFQGKEADIVVVSLVRSMQRTHTQAGQRTPPRPEANIGYLVAPERVNVLLSRARRLLIIVGRLEHFERQVTLFPEHKDLQFWRTIAEELRRQEAVVSALDLGLGGA